MTITTAAPPEPGQAAVAGAQDRAPAGRGSYAALLRTLATLIAAYPALPEPRVSPGLVTFWFTGIYDMDLRVKTAAVARYALGAAFGTEFAPHPLSDGWKHWEALRAKPDGGPVIDLVIAQAEAPPKAGPAKCEKGEAA